MSTLHALNRDFPNVTFPPADPAFLKPTPSHVPSNLIRPYPFILGAQTRAAPHGFVAPVHEYPEVFWAERAANGIEGAWIPRSIAALHAVYLDNEHFTARDSAPFAKMIGETWYSLPSESDPPLHQIFRTMLNPTFSPKKMAALEDRIRTYAREAILSFRDAGKCEFMADFAFEFPIRVFLELMGLPQERVAEFLGWEHKLLHEPDVNEIMAATRKIVAYLREEIEIRRKQPRDDLITLGLQLEHQGRRLSDDELLGFCFNLFIGGLDTVSTNSAWQVHHLARNIEDQRFLRENPDRIPAAIDELMRYYAAVATVRTCVSPVELAGVQIMPGDRVLLPTYLGGHDPAEYKNPETVDLTRAPRHVSFGYGSHLCIGMHLARREMRIALEEMLSILPEFSIPPDADITYYLAAIIQPVTLPLVWKA